MRTCKICGAPITRNAKRELCLNCAIRDSWKGRRQYSEISGKILGRFIERANFATYGILPRCRRCVEDCTMYNARGLTRLICKKSPEYEAVARRLEFPGRLWVENVINPKRTMKP